MILRAVVLLAAFMFCCASRVPSEYGAIRLNLRLNPKVEYAMSVVTYRHVPWVIDGDTVGVAGWGNSESPEMVYSSMKDGSVIDSLDSGQYDVAIYIAAYMGGAKTFEPDWGDAFEPMLIQGVRVARDSISVLTPNLYQPKQRFDDQPISPFYVHAVQNWTGEIERR